MIISSLMPLGITGVVHRRSKKKLHTMLARIARVLNIPAIPKAGIS
jgi:hypothetical protein